MKCKKLQHLNLGYVIGEFNLSSIIQESKTLISIIYKTVVYDETDLEMLYQAVINSDTLKHFETIAQVGQYSINVMKRIHTRRLRVIVQKLLGVEIIKSCTSPLVKFLKRDGDRACLMRVINFLW